jgi:hypothetical protein
VPEQSSVVSADAVQPATDAVVARMRKRVLEVVLLVEYGYCLGTNAARCAGERRLSGDDAIGLTVAGDVMLATSVMSDEQCDTYKQLQMKSFLSWTMALRQISLRRAGGSSMMPVRLRQENRWPFFKWMSI